MFIDEKGVQFKENGKEYCFSIGQEIIGNGNSDYSQMFGRITEIREGSHKETDNEGIDIVCEFYPTAEQVISFKKTVNKILMTKLMNLHLIW